MQSSNLQYQPGLASNVPAPSVAQDTRILGHRRPVSVQNHDSRELNVSGVRILLGLGFAIGLAGLFLWGIVRAWLFAP
jgi:hypothetical protein